MSTAGSVKRVRNGTWGFVVDVPSTTGERSQLRRRGFETKKEAQGALTAVIADLQRGLFVRPDRTTLGEFLLNDWLPARRLSLRPSTAAAYEGMIRNYVLPTLGAARLAALDGSALNRLYDALLTEGRAEGKRGLGPGLSVKTVRNVHGLLTRAFKDAVRWGRLARNPCDGADPPRGKGPEMRAWTTDALRQFTAATSEHRYAAIWALLATTGMRRGEVLGLRWSDVNLDSSTVTIRSTRIRFGTTTATSTPKTARGNRTVALGPKTCGALRAWKRTQASERLLCGPAWQDTPGLVVTNADGSAPNLEAFSNLFRKLVRTSGLPPIRLHDYPPA